MSLWVSGESSGEVSLAELFKGVDKTGAAARKPDLEETAFMLCRGGWPEACDLKGDIALNRAFSYLDAVFSASSLLLTFAATAAELSAGSDESVIASSASRVNAVVTVKDWAGKTLATVKGVTYDRTFSLDAKNYFTTEHDIDYVTAYNGSDASGLTTALNWDRAMRLETPDDRWAIDGTVFVANGQLYYVWSGWPGQWKERGIRTQPFAWHSGEPTEPLAHSRVMGAWQLKTEPTCAEKGVANRVCTAEGCTTPAYEETVEFDALGHHLVDDPDSNREATCEQTGIVGSQKCDRDGCTHKVAGVEIPKVDHAYVEGECKWCHRSEPLPREMDPVGVCSWSWHEPMTNIIRRMETNGFKGIQLALSPWVWEGEGSAAQKETFGGSGSQVSVTFRLTEEGTNALVQSANEVVRNLDLAAITALSSEESTRLDVTGGLPGFYYRLRGSGCLRGLGGLDVYGPALCEADGKVTFPEVKKPSDAAGFFSIGVSPVRVALVVRTEEF